MTMHACRLPAAVMIRHFCLTISVDFISSFPCQEHVRTNILHLISFMSPFRLALNNFAYARVSSNSKVHNVGKFSSIPIGSIPAFSFPHCSWVQTHLFLEQIPSLVLLESKLKTSWKLNHTIPLPTFRYKHSKQRNPSSAKLSARKGL